MKFVCVLKDGGDFNIVHVEQLRAAVEKYGTKDFEFVCLSDLSFDCRGIIKVPLELGLPGWWSMIEMFRIQGPAIYMDLDTIVIDSLGPLVDLTLDLRDDQVVALYPWNRRERADKGIATGVTTWNRDMRWLYDKLRGQLVAGQAVMTSGGKYGHLIACGREYKTDQHWTRVRLRERGYLVRFLQMELPGYAQSWKKDLNQGQKDPGGSLIVFHGDPRPWEVGYGKPF